MAWVVGIGIFLLLLFAFPRQMIWLIVALAALAGGVALYYWRLDEQKQAAAARIAVVATFGGSGCDRAGPYPVWITFSNQNSRTIEYTWFTLVAYRRGFSGDVYTDYLSTDKILEPNGVYGACWPLRSYQFQDGKIAGSDPALLDWRVKVTGVTLR